MSSGTPADHPISTGQPGGPLVPALGSFWCCGGRLAIVVLGALVVLQSSDSLDVPKLAYLGTASMALGVAALKVWSMRRGPLVGVARPLLLGSLALSLLIAISAPVAFANGTSPTAWLRDIVPYGLLAAAPILAVDAAATSSRRFLASLLTAAGVLVVMSFSIEWLQRRGYIELAIDRLVFPSGQLALMSTLAAFAVSLVAVRRGRRWAALAGTALGLLLITGTRSMLVIVVVVGVMALIEARARLREAALRLSASALAVLVVLVVTSALVTQVDVARPGGGTPGAPGPSPQAGQGDVLVDRVGSIATLVSDPRRDPSFRERTAQMETAWTAFQSEPLVGVGPGHPLPWVRVSGQVSERPTLDTSLVLPAKFGMLGVAVALVVCLGYVVFVGSIRRRIGSTASSVALLGYGLALVPGAFLGAPFEDKGFALGLALLVALLLVDRREADNEDGPRVGADGLPGRERGNATGPLSVA